MMVSKATTRVQEVHAGASNSLLCGEFSRNWRATELVDDYDPECWVQSVLLSSKGRNL
jgi:hypothetical protein